MSAGAPVDALTSLAAATLADIDRPLAVAVSGGGDSMACLDLFARAARAADRSLVAVTVDHGLRAEAPGEARLVAEACAAHGIGHRVLRWSWDRQGNLQAAARAARYRLVGDWARAAGIGVVLLGHTEDDVAETLLLRLPRAPGVDGLAEMPRRFRRDGVDWARPFLDVSRADLRRYLRERGLAWAEDPSNADPRFDRARARQVLAALAPLGIEPGALAASARHLRAARTALGRYAAVEAARHLVEDRGDLVLADVGAEMPAEILRRLLRAALGWVGGGRPPRQAALDGALARLAASGTAMLAGCRLAREGDGLRIGREYEAVRTLRGGPDALWDGRWRLCPHGGDGRERNNLHVSALGAAVSDCPDWRASGLPRASLMASPALWRGGNLVAAPLAGLSNGWAAAATGRGPVAAFCLRD